MNKIINPFTFSYESIDIHGETTETVVYILETFIKDNIKMRKKDLVIIHGKGSGKLKNKTHEILRKNKKVQNFYIDMYNEGCTIVHLHLSIILENVLKFLKH